MAERHLRKSPESLVIRELQIRTTLRFHFIPVRMAKIKTLMAAYAGNDVGEREHSFIASGIANWYNHFGYQYDNFSEN